MLRKIVIPFVLAAVLIPTGSAAAHDRYVSDFNDTRSPLDISDAGIGHGNGRTVGFIKTFPTFPNRYLSRRGAIFMDVGNKFVAIFSQYGQLKAQVRRYTSNGGTARVSSARAFRLNPDAVGFSAPSWALPTWSGARWYASSVYADMWDETPMRTHW